MTKTLVAVAITALLCIPLANSGVIFIEPAAGGGPTVTIFDDFGTDTEAEYDVWTGAGMTCNISSGALQLGTGTGVCHSDETATPPGNNPTSIDHWAIYRVASGTSGNRGPSLRLNDTTPGGSDINYVMRCSPSGGTLLLRACTSGVSCTTFDTTGTTCDRTDDTYGFAVAGTGTGTEFCYWFWDTGGPTIDGSTTPEDWGEATECLGDTSTIDEAALTDLTDAVNCPTNCAAWGADPANFSNTNTHIGIYNGSSGGIDGVAEWAGGNL